MRRDISKDLHLLPGLSFVIGFNLKASGFENSFYFRHHVYRIWVGPYSFGPIDTAALVPCCSHALFSDKLKFNLTVMYTWNQPSDDWIITPPSGQYMYRQV